MRAILRHVQQHPWTKAELQRTEAVIALACASGWNEGGDREVHQQGTHGH